MIAPPIRSRDDAIDWLRKNFDPEAGRGVQASVAFRLDGAQGGEIGVRIDDGRADIAPREPARPELRLRLAAEDFFAILEGRANADMLFMEDRIGCEGDLALALKLRRLFRGHPQEPGAAPGR